MAIILNLASRPTSNSVLNVKSKAGIVENAEVDIVIASESPISFKSYFHFKFDGRHIQCGCSR